MIEDCTKQHCHCHHDPSAMDVWCTSDMTSCKHCSIDWSIDVAGETDVIEAFNKFIKKWCGDNYPHLIDTDEQDGQFMRDKIQALLDQIEESQ